MEAVLANGRPNLTLAAGVERVAALSASNLTRGFRTVVSAARAAWGPEVQVLAAIGHGRSYNAPSRAGDRRARESRPRKAVDLSRRHALVIISMRAFKLFLCLSASAYSDAKALIKWLTETISFDLYAFAPQKANPFLRSPFQAFVNAKAIQYGLCLKSQVIIHLNGHWYGFRFPADISSIKTFCMTLPGKPTGLLIILISSLPE